MANPTFMDPTGGGNINFASPTPTTDWAVPSNITGAVSYTPPAMPGNNPTPGSFWDAFKGNKVGGMDIKNFSALMGGLSSNIAQKGSWQQKVGAFAQALGQAQIQGEVEKARFDSGLSTLKELLKDPQYAGYIRNGLAGQMTSGLGKGVFEIPQFGADQNLINFGQTLGGTNGANSK